MEKSPRGTLFSLYFAADNITHYLGIAKSGIDFTTTEAKLVTDPQRGSHLTLWQRPEPLSRYAHLGNIEDTHESPAIVMPPKMVEILQQYPHVMEELRQARVALAQAKAETSKESEGPQAQLESTLPAAVPSSGWGRAAGITAMVLVTFAGLAYATGHLPQFRMKTS